MHRQYSTVEPPKAAPNTTRVPEELFEPNDKARMVDLLLELSAIDFPLAIAWAHAIQRRWPAFKEM
jgi:hypothetical protein